MYGRLDGDNRYLMLFLAAIVFLGIAAFVGTRENDLDRVEREGKRLDAWVTGADQRMRRTSGGGRGSHSTTTDYFLRVRFVGPDGRNVEGSRQVSSAAFDDFERASPEAPISTTVILDAGGDWYAQPELDYQDTTLTLATAFCVGFGLLMFLIGLYTLHRRRYPGTPPRSMYTDQPPGAEVKAGPQASGPP